MHRDRAPSLPTRAGLFLSAVLVATSSLAAVGVTRGDFGVSGTGTANYQIPLTLPPGTNGLTPRLAIVYSHHSGDGLLGMGFGIAGLSAITRCNKTIAQDGAASAPALLTSDGYCLDGNRLRLDTGTYGAADSIYRTEIETFAKVTAKSTAGNGPAWWEVRTKDGLTYEYGNTAESRIETYGSTTVRLWAVNKISDRLGNYIVFAYHDDTTNGSHRIKDIQYTGNTGAGVNPVTKVEFVYETATRPDPLYAYRYGNYLTSTDGKVNEFKRLDRIDVISLPSTTVRTYELTYESAGGAGARSRLQSIEECAGGDCFSATAFQWINGTVSWDSEGSTGQAIAAPANTLVMDLSGDGRDDLVFSSHATSGSGYWYYMLGTATGYAAAVPTSIVNYNYTEAQAIEWNGDDMMDVLVPCNGTSTWWVLQSTGSGFTGPTNTTTPSTGSNGWVLAADINADSRDDLVRIDSSVLPHKLKVRLREASGFASTETIAWTSPSNLIRLTTSVAGLPGASFKSLMRRMDFDGDSRQDFVLRILEKGGEPGISDIYYWSAFYGQGSTIVKGESAIESAYPPRTGDFNSDNLTDLAIIGTSQWFIYYGQGFGFASAAGPSLTGTAFGSALMIDHDADGMTDLVVPKTSTGTWHYSRSTGNAMAALTDTGLAVGTTTYPRAADVNGDGLAEITREDSASSNTWKFRLHSGVPADLLDRATDGFGAYVDFSYAPLSAGSPTYTKGTLSSYPTREHQSSLQVVASLTAPGGDGAAYTKTFGYTAARTDAYGRGFLGFATRTETDSRNGVIQSTDFRQDHPYIGMPSYAARKQGGGTKIHEVSLTLANHTYLSGTQERRFPYVSQSLAKDYEAGGTYNGTHIRTVTTTNTVDTWGTNYDSTTSTQEIATGLSAGATHTQRTWHQYVTNDSANWCLSRPTTTQQINSHTLAGGTQITRTVERTWDFPNCRLTQEIIEPSSTQWKVTTDLEYDSFGNVDQQTMTPVGQAARVTTADWGTTGRFLQTITNPLSQSTTLTWFAPLGVLDTISDPNSLALDFDYDGFGRRTRELRPDGTATRWTLTACNSGNSYCGWGDTLLKFRVQTDLRNTSDAVVQDSYVSFDLLGQPKYSEGRTLGGSLSAARIDYDTLGRVSQRMIPRLLGSGDPTKYLTYTYDLLNRLKKEEREISEANSSLQSTQWTYDGLAVTETDAENHSTTKTFSAVGQAVQVLDALSNDTQYEYDAFGNLVKTRDVASNEITLGYNIVGFRTSSSDPDMGNWTYDYFPLGELKSQTDAKSQTVQFTYDKLSRPLTRVESEGTTTWTWGTSAANKNIGQLAQITSPGSYSETYSFDSYGRPSQTSIVGDGTTYQYNQSYNTATGLLETLTYPTSTSGVRFKLKYAYQNGHLQTVHDYTGDVQTTKFWELIDTNARGQVMNEEFGNGLRTHSNYDHIAGWLDYRQSAPGGGTTTQHLDYAWDKVGNLTERQDENQSITEGFTYDALDRLATTTGVSSLTMGYNAIGNITSKSDIGSYSYTTAQSGCSYYTHTQPHAVRNAGGTIYCYDANGNMVSRGGASVSWTSYNLPSQINQTGGNSSQFWYGPFRQRYKQVNVSGSTTTTTIYAGGLLEKVTTGSATDYKHQVLAAGQTVAIHIRSSTSTNSTYYPLKDHLGSIDRLTNSSGAVVVALSYDAFGKRRGSNWTGSPSSGDWNNIAATTRHGYTEHEHLDNLTLVHTNGRVYDPALGRFISADPFVQSLCNAQSLNRYSYVWNNPLSYTDPSGFERTARPRLPVPDKVPELGEMDVTDRAPGGGGYAGFYGGGDPRGGGSGEGHGRERDIADLGPGMTVPGTPIAPPTVDIAPPTFVDPGVSMPTTMPTLPEAEGMAGSFDYDKCVSACMDDQRPQIYANAHALGGAASATIMLARDWRSAAMAALGGGALGYGLGRVQAWAETLPSHQQAVVNLGLAAVQSIFYGRRGDRITEMLSGFVGQTLGGGLMPPGLGGGNALGGLIGGMLPHLGGAWNNGVWNSLVRMSEAGVSRSAIAGFVGGLVTDYAIAGFTERALTMCGERCREASVPSD